jgi:phage terminase large subunit GpA-like protein
VREWHQTRPRNEGLDCRVYALAALKIVNPSFRRAAERLERILEARQNHAGEWDVPAEKPKENAQEESEPTVAETVRKIKRSKSLKRRGNFATNW